MRKKVTVGEKAAKAKADPTKYKAIDIGHSMVEDNSIAENLLICARRHHKIFDEDEYCVGFVIASDPLIKGVMRRKFFAMLYLPSPRPEQAVFLYNKVKDQFIKRLWVLPPAFSPFPNVWSMEKLYLATSVPKGYESMKRWSMSFYNGTFWPDIRKEHNITMLSEHEYLHLHREEFIKAGAKECNTSITEPFDFSKINSNEVVEAEQLVLN